MGRHAALVSAFAAVRIDRSILCGGCKKTSTSRSSTVLLDLDVLSDVHPSRAGKSSFALHLLLLEALLAKEILLAAVFSAR